MRGRFLAVLGVLSALVFPVRADSDPIRLTLACESATEPTFRLTFQSVASEPTAIVIGAILLASSMAPTEGHISDAAVPPPPGSYQGPTAPPASGQGQ